MEHLKQICSAIDRRQATMSALISLLLSLSFCAGLVATDANFSSRTAILAFPFCFIISFGVITCCYRIWEQRSHCLPQPICPSLSVKSFVIIFALIVCIWLICFTLFLFPGILTADSLNSINQSLGRLPLDNRHPVTFTLIVSVFIHIGLALGSLELGIAMFSVFQLLLLAFCCACCSYWLLTRINAKWGIIAALFFAFNPLICRYAVSMWKDILFSALVLLLVLFLLEIIRTKEAVLRPTKYLVILAFLTLATCLARSNGLPAILFTLVILVFAFRDYKRCMLGIASGMILSIIITGPIYSIFGVQPTPFREAVGLPLQQLALSYINEGDLSEEGSALAERLWDKAELESVYSPKTVDPAKSFEKETDAFLEENRDLFFSAWITSMPQNASYYLSAWRDLTLGYWYAGATSWVSTNPGYSLDAEYSIDEFYNIDHYGLLVNTGIGQQFSSTAVVDFIRLFPSPLFPLYNIATLAWLIVIIIAFKLCEKSYDDIIPLLPVLGIWISILLSAPTNCEFRYVFSFHLGLPLVIALACWRISPSLQLNPTSTAGKGSDDTDSPSALTAELSYCVANMDMSPMLHGKFRVGEDLDHTLARARQPISTSAPPVTPLLRLPQDSAINLQVRTLAP